MKIFYFLTYVFLSFFYFIPVNAENAHIGLKYGISSHNIDTTVSGATIDEEDEGFLFEAGSFIGSNWGLELIYYDLGTAKITGSVGDSFTTNSTPYHFDTAGTVEVDTTGYGLGIFGSSSGDSLFGFNIALGAHNWNREGSTNLLSDNTTIDDRLFNDGVDLYASLGASMNLFDIVELTVDYDTFGFSDTAGLDQTQDLVSIGFRSRF
tara:strand:+ start:256 stop:879 length:624 start_codon:yes stop_codon:yes gene_type:complete